MENLHRALRFVCGCNIKLMGIWRSNQRNVIHFYKTKFKGLMAEMVCVGVWMEACKNSLVSVDLYSVVSHFLLINEREIYWHFFISFVANLIFSHFLARPL